jgi:hypothetical protein
MATYSEYENQKLFLKFTVLFWQMALPMNGTLHACLNEAFERFIYRIT